MAHKISKEETRIMQSIEKLPFTQEDRDVWKDIIQNSGVNEELVKDMLEKSTQLVTPEGEDDVLALARNSTELARNVQSWRLAQNLRNFSDHRRR